MLIAALVSALVSTLTPVSAPVRPVITVAASFAATRVDTTAGARSVDLMWTVTDSAPQAHTLGGVIEFGQFAGGRRVGPLRSLTWNLQWAGVDVGSESGDIRRSTYRYPLRVPQAGPAGATQWRVTKLTAGDDLGHRTTRSGTVARLAVTHLADTEPPTAVVRLDPGQPAAVFDNGSGVTARYRVDAFDGYGFWTGRLILAGPGGRRVTTGFEAKDTGGWALTCGPGTIVYEPPTTASCVVPVTLPTGARSGAWTVARLDLTDVNGNTRRVTPPGAPTLRVSRNEVLSASGFRLEPAQVDNWRTARTSALVFTPRGAAGGLVAAEVTTRGCGRPPVTPVRRGDGTAAVLIDVPPLFGSCVIEGVALRDGAGHEAFYGSAHAAPALGLIVTRVPDTTPPLVRSARLVRDDWTQGELAQAGSIGLDVVVDNTSGAPVRAATTTVHDSAGRPAGGGSAAAAEGPSGELRLAVPVGALPPGPYTVGFTLDDAAGNHRTYGPLDLTVRSF